MVAAPLLLVHPVGLLAARVLAQDSDERRLQVWALVAAGLAVGIGIPVLLHGWRRRWDVLDTPTSSAAAVFIGRNEVIGRAEQIAPLVSPISRVPCVWFRIEIEQYVWRGGRSREWVQRETGETAAPFWLVDHTGRVLVRPRGAKVEDPTERLDQIADLHPGGTIEQLRHLAEGGRDEVEVRRAHEGREKRAPERFVREPFGSLGRHWRVREKVLEADRRLYVLGHASLRADVVAPELTTEATETAPTAHRARRMLITTRSPHEQVASAETEVMGGLAGAFLGLAALPAAFRAAFVDPDGGPAPGDPSMLEAVGHLMIGGPVLLAVALGVLYLVRLHHRLVLVEQQAANAWSLIDVAIRRRHHLIPELVEITRAHAAHEQAVQEALAHLRAGPALPEREHLPSDASLQQMTAVDRADRADAVALLGLAEAHPALGASESFARLQAEITATEDQVAYARRFYNDAVTLLRDRRQEVTGLLMAPLLRSRTWHLFEAEEAAAAATQPWRSASAPAPAL